MHRKTNDNNAPKTVIDFKRTNRKIDIPSKMVTFSLKYINDDTAWPHYRAAP